MKLKWQGLPILEAAFVSWGYLPASKAKCDSSKLIQF
jgi:hypothetical protein